MGMRKGFPGEPEIKDKYRKVRNND